MVESKFIITICKPDRPGRVIVHYGNMTLPGLPSRESLAYTGDLKSSMLRECLADAGIYDDIEIKMRCHPYGAVTVGTPEVRGAMVNALEKFKQSIKRSSRNAKLCNTINVVDSAGSAGPD